MRRYTILYILLLSALTMARGQTSFDYRFWMDDDEEGQRMGNVTRNVPGDTSFYIDLSTMTAGIHAMHLQVRKVGSDLSSVYTRYFVKVVDGDAPVEYWFDCDVSTKKSVAAVGSIDIDVSALTPGVHTLHYQTIGSSGVPSSCQTHFLVKMVDGDAPVEYWFDSDVSVKKKVTANGSIDIDVSTLAPGLHTIHYQMPCTGGVPSACQTQLFVKMPASDGLQLQYWFDNDWETLHGISTASSIIDLDVSDLAVGLHALHIQTLDSSGVPSATRTRFIYVSDLSLSQLMASVWFDDNLNEATTYALADGDPIIDISELSKGEHTIHVVLVDTEGVIYGEESLTILVNVTTGFGTVSVVLPDRPAYNLQGQPVRHSAKGILIKGDKKVFMK